MISDFKFQILKKPCFCWLQARHSLLSARQDLGFAPCSLLFALSSALRLIMLTLCALRYALCFYQHSCLIPQVKTWPSLLPLR